MREIKFRGRRIDNSEWVYGDLWQYQGRTWMVPVIDGEAQRFEVDPETVGQYTELKDRNGKDIYEGDIVEHKSKSINYSDSFIVANCEVFRNVRGTYRIRGKQIYETDLYIERKAVEVIGNIFDHPHLLKGEQA